MPAIPMKTPDHLGVPESDLLAGAKRPMLFLGTGAQGAVEEVRALCDLLGLPAVALEVAA